MNSDLQDLEMLDAILWTSSQNVFTASATKHFLNQQFYGLSDDEMRKVFKQNIANNILFAGNSSLIESSIVEFYEHMVWHNNNRNVKIESEDLRELRKHRVVISHSATVNFTDDKVQEFYAARMQYKDNVVVRIWRIRKTVLEKIEELGGANRPALVIVPLPGSAELICCALNLTLRPDSTPYQLKSISDSLPDYFAKFQAAIEKAVETP
jgi:hypothetical protein